MKILMTLIAFTLISNYAHAFDDWAFNWLVNEIENGNLRDGYRYEQDNGSMVITKIDDSFNIAIRAYHTDRGWLSVEFTYKLPTQN